MMPLDSKVMIELRADILGSNLRLGKGKKELIVQLITNALGKRCPYCSTTITLENCSIDHMEPYGDTAVRERGTQAMKAHFDRIDNLHITCKPCNQQKEDFSHIQWLQLLAFMAAHPGIEPLLKKRLSRSRRMWK